MNNALLKVAESKALREETIRKKIEEDKRKFAEKKWKLKTIREGRRTELKKLIELKLELADERKILNKLSFRNEIDKKVFFGFSFLKLTKRLPTLYVIEC